MTAPTPATLARHELTGLPVRVVDATDPARVGTAGRVVRETTNTLVVATPAGERQLPKQGTTFEFALVGDDERTTYVRDTESPDPSTVDERSGEGTATDPLPDGAERVVVEGWVLVARPARRTQNGARSTWH